MIPFTYDTEIVRGPDEVEGGWKNPGAMGMSTCVVYDPDLRCYLFFEGDEGRKLLLETLNRERTLSFNGLRFDTKVLLGNDRELIPHSDGSVTVVDPVNNVRWKEYDLLYLVIKSKFELESHDDVMNKLNDPSIHKGLFNLVVLCRNTIGVNKLGEGAMAMQLYRERRMDQLFQYNLQDVRMLKQLFQFVKKYGYVIDGTRSRVDIGWFKN